jgi:tripartite-type tricarboxylate transporter receptor subunit TctC
MNKTKTTLLMAASLATTLVGANAAQAQADFPTRPITIVVGAAPGGSTDALARLIAQTLSEELGGNVVVENLPGAGGTVGMQRCVTADADGYTLCFGNMGHIAANVAIYPNLGFDPLTDFAPLGVVANVPMVLAVSNQSGLETLQDLLDYMEENPGMINVGTAGPGSTGHLAPTLLLSQTGLDAELVTYQGAGPALNDLFAGRIDMQIDQTVTMIPVHKEGQAKILAVASTERVEQMPDVPTFIEAGLPEFDMVVWNGLVAPAGTPDAVLERLETALNVSLDDEELVRRFADLAALAPQGDARGSDAFGALIASDVERWLGVLGTP